MTAILVFSTVVAMIGIVAWIVFLLWAAREDGRDQERRDQALQHLKPPPPMEPLPRP